MLHKHILHHLFHRWPLWPFTWHCQIFDAKIWWQLWLFIWQLQSNCNVTNMCSKEQYTNCSKTPFNICMPHALMLKKTERESSITKMCIMKDYGFKNAWLSALANGNGRCRNDSKDESLTHDCCNENSGLEIVVNASYAKAAPLVDHSIHMNT